jgi:glutamate synthase domain-containing protein 1
MCGIIGYVGKKNNALDVIIEGLLRLEYRGYDSAGIAYVKDGLLNITSSVCNNFSSAIKKNLLSLIFYFYRNRKNKYIKLLYNAQNKEKGRVIKLSPIY